MHPAFLPRSFSQMVTKAPAGLTITPSGLIRGTGRSLAPAPSRLPGNRLLAVATITFIWTVS